MNVQVVDGADGLTPDMLRKPAKPSLTQPPDQEKIVMSTLPTEFRGSVMESHTGWPRTWTATDAVKAGIVLEHVQRLIQRSGFPEAFTVTNTGLTIQIDRKDVTP